MNNTIWCLNCRIIFSTDFLCLKILVLAAFTVLSDHLDALYYSMTFVTFSFIMLCDAINTKAYPQIKSSFSMHLLLNKITVGRRAFLTTWRANVLVAAAITILAVDFDIFPRRFCKTETFGTGLMDIGVGAFILSNGIVSPEARNKHSRYFQV